MVAYAKWTPQQYNCKIIFSGDFSLDCKPSILITHSDGSHSIKTLEPHTERVLDTENMQGMYPTWKNIVVGEFDYTVSYGDRVEILAFSYSYTTTEDLIVMGTYVGELVITTTYSCEHQMQTITGETTINVVFTKTEVIDSPYSDLIS